MASADPAAAAVLAAAAAPPDGHGVPDLTPVAEAIARAAQARWCVIALGEREYAAGEPGPGAPVEVTSGGEVVALLRLDASGEVVHQVAAALGPVCANAGTALLLYDRRRAEQAATSALADARLRAAADLDTERRELERDLHDGAQHHLVSLGVTVGLLENVLETGGNPQPWLDRLGEQLDTAERTLASTAAGVLPVTLVRSGLVAALTSELGDERLDAAELGERRFPAVVESAVWFTCLEAVNNARKHAPGAALSVSLRSTARGLAFVVADDGPGFTVTPSASGLDHMRARVEAVGGTVEIRSAPGEGTTVSGFVPI